jgi:hypothetical protein
MNHSDFKGYKPTQKQAHLQTAQSHHASQSLQKSLLCQRTETEKIYRHKHDRKEGRSANITYTQAGVSCFVGQESSKFKVQFFVGSSVVKIPACV